MPERMIDRKAEHGLGFSYPLKGFSEGIKRVFGVPKSRFIWHHSACVRARYVGEAEQGDSKLSNAAIHEVDKNRIIGTKLNG